MIQPRTHGQWLINRHPTHCKPPFKSHLLLLHQPAFGGSPWRGALHDHWRCMSSPASWRIPSSQQAGLSFQVELCDRYTYMHTLGKVPAQCLIQQGKLQRVRASCFFRKRHQSILQTIYDYGLVWWNFIYLYFVYYRLQFMGGRVHTCYVRSSSLKSRVH